MEAPSLLRGAVRIARTCIVRRKKACRAETVVHRFKICGARQYVVASVKRIKTETIASAELYPIAGHGPQTAIPIEDEHATVLAAIQGKAASRRPFGRPGRPLCAVASTTLVGTEEWCRSIEQRNDRQSARGTHG